MYLSADAATRSIRPLVNGGSQAVLAGEEHKTGHGRDTRSHYQALEAWARERFSVRSVDYRWSAQDYLPADSVPYIGRLLPGYGRLHVATGFKKWGMTHSAVAALLLRDHITGRSNPWSGLFRATRLHPLASAKELAVHTDPDGDPDQALAALGQALVARGYEPYDEPDGTIRLRNCPFDRIAAHHRELVCEANHAMLQALTDQVGGEQSVRTVLDPQPGRCCVTLTRNP